MKWEARFRAAIRALSNACDGANARWMLIGGIAVIARGAPRTTEDVDATVLAPGLDIDRFLEACRGHQIIPRIDDVKEMALRAQIPAVAPKPETGEVRSSHDVLEIRFRGGCA